MTCAKIVNRKCHALSFQLLHLLNSIIEGVYKYPFGYLQFKPVRIDLCRRQYLLDLFDEL